MYNDSLRKGSKTYNRTKFIYDTIECCSKLINILSQSMDDFPDMKYEELFQLSQKLIELKWSACELLGDSIK